MGPSFQLFSVMLFIAAASLFINRMRHENPPLLPYLVIAWVCIVANWFDDNGSDLPAIVLLISGAFLVLHLASEPYREETDDQSQKGQDFAKR
ncbi:XrtV sorting system accessory protein [Hyphococcus sp. DH-69]|uniref:XrtV sorting system accessory protein n=1 Tax=Hyphococcus formosus TaxID=3143534 RepID=UPI00398B97C1